jgi:pantoate--beta-alanine ligase
MGVQAVFAPEASVLYPPGAQTFVEVTQLEQGLCGASRPGHFRGVATVVTKLLGLFQPHFAFFGEKDFQQLQVIRRLARDLLFDTEIVGMPTQRESDGLAMSSRNTYLQPDERTRALALSQGLLRAQEAANRGESSGERLEGLVRESLEKAAVRPEYVELVEAESLTRLARLQPAQAARLLVAAFVGRTRLIDNVGIALGGAR